MQLEYRTNPDSAASYPPDSGIGFGFVKAKSRNSGRASWTLKRLIQQGGDLAVVEDPVAKQCVGAMHFKYAAFKSHLLLFDRFEIAKLNDLQTFPNCFLPKSSIQIVRNAIFSRWQARLSMKFSAWGSSAKLSQSTS